MDWTRLLDPAWFMWCASSLLDGIVVQSGHRLLKARLEGVALIRYIV